MSAQLDPEVDPQIFKFCSNTWSEKMSQLVNKMMMFLTFTQRVFEAQRAGHEIIIKGKD